MLNIIVGLNKKGKEKFDLKMDGFSWDADLLRAEIRSISLFANSGIENILLDDISDNEEAWQTLLGLAEGLLKSEKKVTIFQSDLGKEDWLFFKNLGVEIKDERLKKEKTYDFSPFALQDALGARVAKNAWIEYIKLRNLGIEAEEIVPKLASKVRDMLASNMGASKEDLNIKSDYPYGKSKRDFKNWKETDLRSFYRRLVSAYHQARMGGEELDVALETELLQI